MTTRANLYVDQGVDYITELIITSNGDSIDISDKTFYCQIRKVYSSVASVTVEVTAFENENGGFVELYISPEISMSLEPGKYSYDIIMVSISGVRTKILEGIVNILPTVTNIGSVMPSQGVQGAQGTQGIQGIIGQQGPIGLQGTQGLQGPGIIVDLSNAANGSILIYDSDTGTFSTTNTLDGIIIEGGIVNGGSY